MTSKNHLPRFSSSQWINAAVLWTLIIALILILSQFFLPSADKTNNSPEARSISDFYVRVFEPFFKADGKGRIKSSNPGLLPCSFDEEKAKDTERIFIVGGSVARNLGLSSHIDAFENSLAKLYPGRKIECINAAVPGYDSFRVLRVLNEIINYSPDCIIILSGNNEFFEKGLTRSDRLVYLLRKIRLLNLCLPAPAQKHTPRNTQTRLDDYKNNLIKMLRLAHDRNIPAILCTVPANSSDFAPYGPFPEDGQYVKASEALLKKDFQTAQTNAEEYIKLHPENALGYYLAGQIAAAQGRDKQAENFFATALNLDYGTNTRTCPKANTIVRLTAKEQGAVLADIQKDIEVLKEKGIPDRQIFTDICHLRETARPVIFNRILRALSPSAPPLPVDLGDITAEPMEKQFAWFASDCLNSPDIFLSEQSFSKFRLVFLSQGLNAVKQYPDNKQALIKEVKNFIELQPQPDWRVLDACTGEGLRRLGQTDEALKYLSKARDAGLRTAPLYISLALIMHSAGNEKEAVQYINTALGCAKQSSRPLAETVREIILNQ